MHAGTCRTTTPWLRPRIASADRRWQSRLGWVEPEGHPPERWRCPKRKQPRSQVRSVVDDRDQRRRRPRQRSVTHMPEAGADSLLIYCSTAMMAHLLMSLGQTLFHRYLGHSRFGGRFFKNHIQFHHVHYAGDHVVSTHYLDEGDNNTLFFLMPVVLVVGLSYLFLRLDLLVVQLAAMSLSFCGHYYIDNQYHVARSWLGRFLWFRRKQQLHFIHHLQGKATTRCALRGGEIVGNRSCASPQSTEPL